MQDENEIVQSNLGVIKTMWISRAMHFECETRVLCRRGGGIQRRASAFLFLEESSWNENVKPSATVARKQKHVAPQSLSSQPLPLFSPLMDSSNYSFVWRKIWELETPRRWNVSSRSRGATFMETILLMLSGNFIIELRTSNALLWFCSSFLWKTANGRVNYDLGTLPAAQQPSALSSSVCTDFIHFSVNSRAF